MFVPSLSHVRSESLGIKLQPRTKDKTGKLQQFFSEEAEEDNIMYIPSPANSNWCQILVEPSCPTLDAETCCYIAPINSNLCPVFDMEQRCQTSPNTYESRPTRVCHTV